MEKEVNPSSQLLPKNLQNPQAALNCIGIGKQCSNNTPGINTQFPSNKKYQGHNYPVPELLTRQQVLATVRELGD